MNRVVQWGMICMLCFLAKYGWTQQNDTLQIKELVGQLFDGMRSSDTSLMAACFHDECSMFTAMQRGDQRKLFASDVEGFLKSVGAEHKEIYDERLGEYAIYVDGLLATMAVKYYFFLDDQFSHCGTNFFSFFKTSEGWKIYNIADTRYKDTCEIPENTW